jgi:hypothetical protein
MVTLGLIDIEALGKTALTGYQTEIWMVIHQSSSTGYWRDSCLVRQKAVWLQTHHCINSNTKVRTKSIRLDSIVSIPHWLNFPFILYIILRPQPYSSRNISGSNRGLQGDVKKSKLDRNKSNTKVRTKSIRLDSTILIPHRLNFHFILHFVLRLRPQPYSSITSLDPTGV